MYPAGDGRGGSAAASGTKSRAIGFTFGTCLFVLHTDLFCAAVVIYGVVLASSDIAGNAGILTMGLLAVHKNCLPF